MRKDPGLGDRILAEKAAREGWVYPESGRVGPPPAEVANPPMDLPKADAPGFLDRVITWAETRSRERTPARPSDRPGARFGGSQVNVYDVIATAAKAVRAGVRTAAKVRDIVREHFGRDDADVARKALRMIRAAEVNGAHDDAKFELLAGDMLDAEAESAPVKATVRETTGQVPNEPDTITQREALAGQLKAEERGAARVEKERQSDQKAATKAIAAKGKDAQRRVQQATDAAVGFERAAGKAEAARKLSEQAQKYADQRQAEREKFTDEIDKLRTKSTTGEDIRRDLVRLARQYLDLADRGKVLEYIATARAKDPTKANPSVSRDWFMGLKKILKVAETSDSRKALKELQAVTGKASKKSEPKLASAVNDLLNVKGEREKFRKGKVGLKEVAQLRTPHREAVEPVVDAVRNGGVVGSNKLADFIQAETDQGRSNAFDDAGLALLRSTEGKILDDLDASQRRVVADALQHVAYLSDEGNRMQVLGERRELEQVRSDVIQAVRDRWGTKEAINPGKSEKLGGLANLAQSVKDFVVTDQDTLSTMVGTVAGRDSLAHKVLYEDVAKGQSDQIRFRRELVKDAQLDKWTPADIANAQKKREVKYSGGKFKMTGAEMMDIVGLWNDPDSRAEIEKSGLVLEADRGTNDRIFFLTDRDISAIELSMTPKERAAVPVLQRALKKGYDAANDAHETMNGFRLPDSPNHWSRRRDISGTEREISGDMEQQAKRHRWFEDASVFKARSTSDAAVVVRDALEWVPQQLDTLAGMAHLAIPMRNARRVMADPNVKTEFARKGGDNWVRTFESRLAEAVGGAAGDPSNANKIGQRLLGFYARNKLAWRISTVGKQKLGFFQAAAAVEDPGFKARIMAQGANVANLSPAVRAKLRAEIDARSGYLAERADPTLSATLASAANPQLRVAATRLGRLWQSTERVSLSGLRLADSDIVFGTYIAAKQHLAKTKKLTGDALKDAAVWETEKIIRDSQNPTSVLDMSGVNLSGRRNIGLASAFLFSSSSNKIRNQLRQVASDYAADPSRANFSRLAQTATLTAANAIGSRLVGYALKGATLAAIISALSGSDLKDRKETVTSEAVGALGELLDVATPGLGEAVRVPAGQSFSPATYPLRVYNAVGRAIKAYEDMEDSATKTRRVIRAVRSLEVLPDAPLDYTEQIVRGLMGDE